MYLHVCCTVERTTTTSFPYQNFKLFREERKDIISRVLFRFLKPRFSIISPPLSLFCGSSDQISNSLLSPHGNLLLPPSPIASLSLIPKKLLGLCTSPWGRAVQFPPLFCTYIPSPSVVTLYLAGNPPPSPIGSNPPPHSFPFSALYVHNQPCVGIQRRGGGVAKPCSTQKAFVLG